ncbi:alpha-L-arabinofuranosidase C-terminal domain-containing protein [Sphaerimonospora sp. CA-214678]|uniref:alpha-L-arabinofuranosidase C-terminal domain-containing protein n=1 Tax=Sphaerimonospora sp. CA-214678 TaxID=3240029 RepID=UPI003D8D1731
MRRKPWSFALTTALAASLLTGTPPASAADATTAVAAGPISRPITANAPIPADAVVDQFDRAALGSDWQVLAPDNDHWSLTEQPGVLRIHSLKGDTYQTDNSARNLFLMDVPSGDFEVVAEFAAPVSLDFQSAGILAWQDWDNYVRTGLAHVGFAGGDVIETDTEVKASFSASFTPRAGSTGETLRLARKGDEFTSSYWDGSAWVEAAKVTAALDVRQVGLFALSAQDGTSLTADFDYFAVKAAEGAPAAPSGPFTLRATGTATPYLSADGDGRVTATDAPGMTSLALTAEAVTGDGGGADGSAGQVRLKDLAGHGYLRVGADAALRLGDTPDAFQIVDAGGGKVRLTVGDRSVAVVDGRLVAGDETTRFQIERYAADIGELKVDTAAAGTEVGDDLYGIFYEDINHAADGGLYAELVQNRSFEFDSTDNRSYTGLTAWTKIERGGATGTIAVSGDRPLNDYNRNHLRLDITAPGSGGGVGVSNSGFNRGLAVQAGKKYDLSFFARRTTGGPVKVSIESADGSKTYGGAALDVRSADWQKYQATITASETTDTARLVVLADGTGRADFDMISLFPRDTFKGRSNGMRKDIAETIAALKPRFLRFPGGCVTNVGTYDPYSDRQDRRRIYQWKETIGPVEERPTNFNFWGYNQSYGIGYHEYFQFAEDLGAEPLPVLSVGVNGCNENRPLTDEARLARWVQDTLDLIEFANGPKSSEWGAKRAALGHPEPFGLKYIGLGNEEIYDEFFTNYPKFADAIRAEHPDIKIITNSGQTSQGAWFDRMWQFARDQKADLVDEHYYNDPSWFLANNHRYDSYDRNGPKVFVGEYASKGNTLYNALTEASYLTGIERNADVVELASYAPLLANVDYVDWAPDLIWFDNDEVYGSPSYYVQRMFSRNVGDRVLPSTFRASPLPVADIKGGIGLGSWSTQVRYDDVKVTAADGTVLFSDDFSGDASRWTPGAAGAWSVEDGAYVQSADVIDARTTAGSTDWSNYTLEVTARKTGGAEGFLVMFGVRGTGDFYWWNLGGWNNTQSAIEKATDDAKSSIATSGTTIETNRDYKIKIQVAGRRITTWLDGQKINDFTDNATVEPLYQVVSKDDDTGDIVIKAVNAQDTAVRAAVDLDSSGIGGAKIAPKATVTSLTGDPADGNSIAEPTRVAPVEREMTGFSSSFTYDFPAHSVTFIRLGKDRRAEAKMTAHASPEQVKQGKKVQIHVSVPGGTGRVTVSEGAVILGEITLNRGGQGKTELGHDLPPGTHRLTIAYAGDARHAPATTTLTLVVKP